MGWTDLGCYGSKSYDTPNIDKLAAQGMRFTNAYAACPVCSPTRASIMTGKYPARLHLTDWIPGTKQWPSAKLLTPAFRQELPLAEVTLAEALKPAGYASASIGKWHLGGEGFSPTEQGFDRNVGGTARGSPVSYFGPFDLPGLGGGPEGEYLTDRLSDEAEQFITENQGPAVLFIPAGVRGASAARGEERSGGEVRSEAGGEARRRTIRFTRRWWRAWIRASGG